MNWFIFTVVFLSVVFGRRAGEALDESALEREFRDIGKDCGFSGPDLDAYVNYRLTEARNSRQHA